jgi:hypothetical protein
MHFITSIRHLWTHHKVIFTVLCFAIAALVFFTVRLIVFTLYWSDPAHRFQPLEGWMTPGYITRSYQIDPDMLGELLQVDKQKPKGLTLEKIAQSRGIDVDTLIENLQPALNEWKITKRD